MDKYIKLFIEEIISKNKIAKEPETWEEVDIESLYPDNTDYSDEEIEYQEKKADEELEKYFEEVENFIEGENTQTVSELTGLFHEQFPPIEKLKLKHKKLVIKAFRELLASHRVHFDFPKKLPVDFQYELIVESLEEEVYSFETGYQNIDYCTGVPEECRLKEYCHCLNQELINFKNDYLPSIEALNNLNNPNNQDKDGLTDLPF